MLYKQGVTKISARMATFPPRLEGLRKMIQEYLVVFPRLYICLNEMRSVPSFLQGDDRIVAIIPDKDLKAAGKFAAPADDDEIVFLVDDDIIYPPDYVQRMVEHLAAMGPNVVVGVHGIRYRVVGSGQIKGDTIGYKKYNLSYKVVDSLGTGTVCGWGMYMPPLEYVTSAHRYVDLRFARYCTREGIEQVAVPRPSGWLRSSGNSVDGLWDTYGSKWPKERTEELEFLVRERQAYRGNRDRVIRANKRNRRYRLECLSRSIRDVVQDTPMRIAVRLYRAMTESNVIRFRDQRRLS